VNRNFIFVGTGMARCPVILVAEDQPDSVDLLKLAFSTSGVAARVNYVEDGEVAIEYLSGEEPFGDRVEYPLPAILLLDLNMPRRDGFQVLEWLRLQPGLRRLVVVVFSSSADPKDINRAFALGANSYVVKPGGFNELKETVRRLDNYWLGLNQCPDCVPEASPPNGGRRVLLRNTTNGRYFRGGRPMGGQGRRRV